MKINKTREITFATDETIMTATISKPNEIAMLMSSGSVIRFNLDNLKGEYLFSAKSPISFHDGGFDITAKTSIYTLDEIVVVVNDFKKHGFVHYPGKYDALHLWRKDYYADISAYPIALYSDKDGIPHLIFGADWNHIQIMNLDTRQILTAAKSLIEEGAEESYIEFYKTYPEHNKLSWPTPYNYFFGRLYISPDQKQFLSSGWAWGSSDCYNVYDIEKFISSNRISALNIGAWEHENRAVCWVDNDVIAVIYDPFTEGEENSTAESPCEIHFHKIIGGNVEVVKKIQIDDKAVRHSKLYYDPAINSFVALSEQTGVFIISLEGQVLLKEECLNLKEYNVATGLFLLADNKTIELYQIEG